MEDGFDIRTIQERPGDQVIKTTMMSIFRGSKFLQCDTANPLA
jgi:hypothetical protein